MTFSREGWKRKPQTSLIPACGPAKTDNAAEPLGPRFSHSLTGSFWTVFQLARVAAQTLANRRNALCQTYTRNVPCARRKGVFP